MCILFDNLVWYIQSGVSQYNISYYGLEEKLFTKLNLFTLGKAKVYNLGKNMLYSSYFTFYIFFTVTVVTVKFSSSLPTWGVCGESVPKTYPNTVGEREHTHSSTPLRHR